MVPTRTQVQKKIDESLESLEYTGRDFTYAYVEAWLEAVNCPIKDKEMILDDLGSYEGY